MAWGNKKKTCGWSQLPGGLDSALQQVVVFRAGGGGTGVRGVLVVVVTRLD